MAFAYASAFSMGCLAEDSDGLGGASDDGSTSGTTDASMTGQSSTSTSTSTAAPAASVQSSSHTGMTSEPCDVAGVQGTCIDVVLCQGDHMPVPGHCPGPAEIQCCVPTGSSCDPQASPLPNEGLHEAPGEPGCPAGMVNLEDFCIDRFEASLVDAEGTSLSPFHNPGLVPAQAVSLYGAIPQGYISGEQAGDACTRAGKRLCTNEEWLAACRGPEENIYPYGDMLQLGQCNDHRSTHPAVELFGTNDPSIFSMLDNACLNQLPDSLASTGEYATCVTEAGVFDLMGNLHEWTSDPTGTFRGGYYVDTMINGPGCLYTTTAHNTNHWDYSTGFRCCADK